jgi:pimeloyl-ACP methyl ester carboxylesterase
MYVTLARRLATAGFRVLRFDLSGIGDSEGRSDGKPLLDGILCDIRQAVDWLVTERRAQRIIVVGLCAGADHALVYGISDPRVAGLVLLDPSIPRTFGYYWRYFAKHVVRPRSWHDLAAGRGRLWMTLRKWLGTAPQEALERHRLNLNEPLIRNFLCGAYRRVVDRNMHCLAIFTSGFPHQHNYRRQILDAFPTVPFTDRLQLEYYAKCDHVFTAEANRSRLFQTMMKWAETVGTVEPVEVGEPAERTAAPGASGAWVVV